MTPDNLDITSHGREKKSPIFHISSCGNQGKVGRQNLGFYRIILPILIVAYLWIWSCYFWMLCRGRFYFQPFIKSWQLKIQAVEY